jgi:hypothetical protein
MVVETNDNISSIQQFSIVTAAVASGTATISSVNTARAWVVNSGSFSNIGNNDWNYNTHRLRLTSSTQVTATRDADAGSTTTTNGFVIEAASGVTTSVQEVSATIAAAADTQDTAVTAVTDGLAILFWGGWEIDLFASSNYQRHPYTYRTSTTNVRWARGAVSATTATGTCTLVDFASGMITQRFAAQPTIGTGATTQDTAMTSVNRNKAIISWLGQTGNSSGIGNAAIFWATVGYADNATVRAERGASDATLTISTSFEVCECNDLPAGSLVISHTAFGTAAKLLNLFNLPAEDLALTGNSVILQDYLQAPAEDILLNLPLIDFNLNPFSEKIGIGSTFTEKTGASSSYYEKQEGVIPDTIELFMQGGVIPSYRQKYSIPTGTLLLTGLVPTI